MPGLGVLEHHAVARCDVQSLGRPEVAVGIGLAPGDLVGGEEDLRQGQTRRAHASYGELARRRRDHRPRHLDRLQQRSGAWDLDDALECLDLAAVEVHGHGLALVG
jgi:hypothetical protein